MYGLTTIKGRINHKGLKLMLMVFAFIALSALPATGQAQNTYGGATVVYEGIIELTPGQMVLVAVPNFYFEAGSLKSLKYAEVSVHGLTHAVTERTSNLIYSGESGGLNEACHVFPVRYEDLIVPGDPGTDRIQVWIVVKLVLDESTQRTDDNRSVVVTAPTLELVELGGRTASNAAGHSVSISLRARPELSPSVSEIK